LITGSCTLRSWNEFDYSQKLGIGLRTSSHSSIVLQTHDVGHIPPSFLLAFLAHTSRSNGEEGPTIAVEPVETTIRSSKKEDVKRLEDSTAVERKKDVPTKRRFIPEPVETSYKSSKRTGDPLPTPEPTPVSIPRSSPPQETPKPRRKFTPELIETSKRSKRAGDSTPATLHTDKASRLIYGYFNCSS